MVGQIKNWSISKRITAAVLACAVVLSAAAAVTIPLINAPKAVGETPGTAAYYNARWEDAKTQVGKVTVGTAYTDYQGSQATVAIEGPWMLENLQQKVEDGKLSAPWNGVAAGTKPTDTVNGGEYNAAINPWKVTTAEQLRYCVGNGQSFQLQNDIDLGGYAGRTWGVPAASSATWSADGNGYTIYNLYMNTNSNGTGIFGANENLAVKNLRISNSYANSTGNWVTLFFGGGGANTVRNSTITNCAIEKSWVRGTGGYGGAAGFSSGFKIRGIYNSYIRDSVVYGTSHVAATAAQYGVHYMENSFAADSVVISTGHHSGGFASCCSDCHFTNCFSSNVDMYCNSVSGNFYSTGVSGRVSSFTNCFASGKMEGLSNVGGFTGGSPQAGATVTNCYTTTMVGLLSNATRIGGFVGSSQVDSGGGAMSMSNCYAAGEVGSIDTIVTPNRTEYKTVGGFTGQQGSAYTYDNCYYDKQTTAMREWETGEGRDGGINDIAGIKGLLTTTTNDAIGMSDPAFATMLGDAYNSDLGEGYYPQLNAFSDPVTFTGFKGWVTDEEVQNIVKACSLASVSTVQMNTWDKDYAGNDLPETTYDTVRDVVSEFSLSSGSGSVPEREREFFVPGENIALGKPATASSGNATLVTDGSSTTYWTKSSGDPITAAWIYVDLGKVTDIARISVSAQHGYFPRKYEIQISNDASDDDSWRTVHTEENVAAAGDQHVEFAEPLQARYVRIASMEREKPNPLYVYIGEIEVYSPDTSYTVKYPAYNYAVDGWKRCGVTGQGTLNTGTGAQSGVNFGESLNPNVICLVKRSGQWIGTQPMPGIDWVRVSTSVGDAKGYRSLRICPTVGMDAGLSRYLGDHIPYDHADDVRLAYSTGGRLDKGNEFITYGVFPDVPLAAKQNEFLQNSDYANVDGLLALFDDPGQNNSFSNVNVAHMERINANLDSGPDPINATSGVINEVIIRSVLGENADGSVVLGERVNLEDPENAKRWNGETEFTDGTKRELYDIEYVWSLTDGRFLRDSKRVEALACNHSVTVRAENLKGDIISDKVYLDAYSISDGAGSVDPDASYNFGSGTKGRDKLISQSAHPVATAWQLKDNTEEIKELQITLTTVEESLFWKTTIPASDLPTPEEPEKTITLIAPYRSHTRDSDNNLIWQLHEIRKQYTITLEDGVYNINFNLEYEDYETGVYVDDLDMEIEVVVVLDTTDAPPSQSEVVIFDFGNIRKDNPWVGDSTNIPNDMPSLGDTGGGE